MDMADPNTSTTRAREPATKWAVRAVALLLLACASAVAAGLLLTNWVRTRTEMARVPTVRVVVAAEDIPVGTQIALEHLTSVDWPAAARPSAGLEDPTQLLGKVAATRIFKSEPVLAEKLVSGSAGAGLAALLPEGMRAASVRVDDVVGVAGFIHPGDYVDVIVTMRPSENSGAPPLSKTVLQNIKVLAVGSQVDARSRGSADKVIAATVATLQVDTAQAEHLALAAAKGQILLTLRNNADKAFVQTKGIGPNVLMTGAVPLPPPPDREAPTATAHRGKPKVRVAAKEAPPPERQVVEILRGDLFERRDFNKEKKGGTP
jgi:pilus assembly protein CpaB